MTVNMGTSPWRTSDSDLERVRWLYPTHILQSCKSLPWDGFQGKGKKDQETKMKGSV